MSQSSCPPPPPSGSRPVAERLEIIPWDSKRFGGIGAPRIERRRRAIRGIVLHVTAGSERGDSARRVCQWWDNLAAKGNAHVVCSDRETIRYAADDRRAWHAGIVNDYTLGIEVCGSADQTAEQWHDDYSRAALERVAAVCALWCEQYGIEPRVLSPSELRALQSGDNSISGFFGHVMVRDVLKRGTHYCPGPRYPYARVLEMVRAKLGRVVVA